MKKRRHIAVITVKKKKPSIIQSIYMGLSKWQNNKQFTNIESQTILTLNILACNDFCYCSCGLTLRHRREKKLSTNSLALLILAYSCRPVSAISFFIQGEKIYALVMLLFSNVKGSSCCHVFYAYFLFYTIGFIILCFFASAHFKLRW